MNITLFKRMWVSVLVGIALIIPGLSGGTILSSTATLEDLTDNAWGIPKKNNPHLKQNIINVSIYILFMLIGAGFASVVIKGLLDTHPIPLYLFFITLMIIAIPVFVKTNNITKIISKYSIIGFVLMILMPFTESLFVGNSQSNNILLFIAAVLAGFSVLLPGLSGSLMLLLFGQYERVITMVKEIDITNINMYVFAIGALTGLIIISKLLTIAYKRKREEVINLSLGLVSGSVVSLVIIFVIDYIMV